MSRRKTVQLNIPYVNERIKSVFRHNVIFCEKMSRAHNWVTDWNREPKPKNLPSPEEAAKMCVLLEVKPEDILTEAADVELVKSLLAVQKEPPQPEAEALDMNDPIDRELLEVIRRLSPAKKAVLCDKAKELEKI